MKPEPQCSICRNYRNGECHAAPPVRLPRKFEVGATAGNRVRDEQLIFGWPTVGQDDWCGHWIALFLSRVPPASPPAAETAGVNDPLTDLVARFSNALLKKLRLAEANGRSGWDSPDWERECQQGLRRHLEKGDPRDVAAYAAFCWHHGWPTATPADTSASVVGDREAIARIIAPATWSQFEKHVEWLKSQPMEPDVLERAIEHERGFCKSSLGKADAIAALTSQGKADAGRERSEVQSGEDSFFNMLWDWFEDESRIGAEGMRPERREGLSADDFKTMLDEHEASLLAESALQQPIHAQASLDPLAWLAEHPNYELSFCGWDEDQVWELHAVNGGRNDREWTLLATGDTPEHVLRKAMAPSSAECK